MSDDALSLQNRKMECANKLNEDDISYIDDELQNNKKPFVRSIFVNEISDKKLNAVELMPRSRSKSAPLLETDNTYNPKSTSGPEIDDLNPDDSPTDTFDDKEIDDDLIRHDDKRFNSGFIPPRDPRIYPTLPDNDAEKSPDVNVYQQKKIIAQGMMDLALISANASQIRYILHTKGEHPFYYSSLSMVGVSLFLQIVIGIGLIWNGRFDVKINTQMCQANRTNNWIVIGVFIVTILNVFISTFSVPDWNDQNYNKP